MKYGVSLGKLLGSIRVEMPSVIFETVYDHMRENSVSTADGVLSVVSALSVSQYATTPSNGRSACLEISSMASEH